MSFDLSGGEPWLDDLKNMERVVEIFELLGGKNEPMIANLVTPYRRWVRTDDLMLKEAPFSASQKIPHRIYLFRDLLVIGRHKEPNRTQFMQPKTSDAESKQPEPLGAKRRSFRLSFSRRKSTNATLEKRSSIRITEDTYKVKLTHYLPLSQCALKSLNNSDGSAGIQLTHVCRIRVDKDGRTQVVTRVEKFEFWLATKEQRDSLETEIQCLIDEEEERARDNEGLSKRNLAISTDSADTAKASGERSWAKNRPKVMRMKAKESADFGGRSRGGSGDSEETTLTTQKEGISLADLAQRYNVDFAQKLTLENTAKYSVEFGEGQMGFSLSSGEGIGVIIGRLAPGSFADLGGCEIGDRLESVNGVEIDMNMTWQHSVEVIKAAGRPITLGFVRNVQLQAKVQAKDDAPSGGASSTAQPAASIVTPAASAKPPKVESSNAGPAGRRRWAANRARHQSGAGGLIGLDDLEKMYKSTATAVGRDAAASSFSKSEKGEDDDTGSVVAADDDDDENAVKVRSQSSFDSIIGPASPQMSSPLNPMDRAGPVNGKAILEQFASRCEFEEERVCVAVLAEILQTEKAYVSDLRSLIKEYVMPLRRATKRKRCRDMDSVSLMCEHGSLRSSCSKQSNESGPMLNPEDVRTIFMNVETLVKVNAELLKAIEEGLTNFEMEFPSSSDVADGLTRLVDVFSSNFEKITPFFTMYALYCHQYPAATERLHRLRTEEDEVDALLREREAKSTSTSLRSLLIKPVQRICRYPMLFQELLKRVTAVEAVYPDRRKSDIHVVVEVIKGTAHTVEKIANDVNQKVHVQETIGSLMNVFHELGGGAPEGTGDEQIKNYLLAPSRRFVRSEEVFFREAPFDSEPLPRKLYLFNDLIILASEREGVANGNNGTIKRKSTASSLNSRTRGKSFGNLVSSFMQSSSSSSNMGNGTGGVNGDGGDEQFPGWAYQVTHWIELQNGEVRPLPKPDDAGSWGFRIKSIRRTTSPLDGQDKNAVSAMGDKRKSTKKITWAAGVKDAPPPSPGGQPTKVVTSIQKYEVWMQLKEKLQLLLTDIEDKILALELLQQNASKGMTKFGASQQRKTRSWIQKKNAKADDALGGGLTSRKSTSGSIDARDALQTISKKYSTGGFAKRGTEDEDD